MKSLPDNHGKKYHKDWKSISLRIRSQARWVCEGTPIFPNCKAINDEPHPVQGFKVVLTVAHMDHDLDNNEDSNLRALCQRCHNVWDIETGFRPLNQARNKRRKALSAGQMDMFNRENK